MKPFLRNAIAAALCTLVAAAVAQEAKRPNILFILTDDLGYGDLACYGQKNIKTPRLDKLASEGIRFTQFYAGSAVCAPSRAALLTGQHMGHNQTRGNGNPPLTPEPATLGKLMKDAGYHTGIIGKWGMGAVNSTGGPLNQGFDEFVGFVGHTEAHEQYPKQLTRNTEKFDLPEGTYANDVFTTEALEFLRRNKENPFFLYLPYTIPHAKLVVPAQGEYAKTDWPEPEKNKAAMITRVDSQIGQVLDELKALGLDENTLVLFSSDNGPHKEGGSAVEFHDSNGPLRGLKRDLYEGGIRVPMIARWTGKIAPAVSEQVWAMWDVMPTFLDIAGAKAPEDRDGISVKSALLSAQPVAHPPLYWEFYERGFTQAIRKDDWKLVKTTTGALELYNLKSDIGENANLAAEHPEVIMELMPLLSSMRTENEKWKVSEVLQKAAEKEQKKKNPGQGNRRKKQ